MENIEEEKITVAINKAIWEEFKQYCAVNAYKISKKIELLLKEEIEKGPKTKSLIDIFKDIIEKQKEAEASKTSIKEQSNEMENPKRIGCCSKVPTIGELMIRKKG